MMVGYGVYVCSASFENPHHDLGAYEVEEMVREHGEWDEMDTFLTLSDAENLYDRIKPEAELTVYDVLGLSIVTIEKIIYDEYEQPTENIEIDCKACDYKQEV